LSKPLDLLVHEHTQSRCFLRGEHIGHSQNFHQNEGDALRISRRVHAYCQRGVQDFKKQTMFSVILAGAAQSSGTAYICH
jgi:hypothetical protein